MKKNIQVNGIGGVMSLMVWNWNLIMNYRLVHIIGGFVAGVLPIGMGPWVGRAFTVIP